MGNIEVNKKNIFKFQILLKEFKTKMNIYMYDVYRYDCEIAQLSIAQQNSNDEQIINFWNEMCNNDFFEIFHPLKNKVKIRALYSCFYNDVHNLVYFADCCNDNQCILIQIDRLFNMFICEEGCFIIHEGWVNQRFEAFMKCIDIISILSVDKLMFRDVIFGFELKNNRPSHYFDHILSGYLVINVKNKMISNGDNFYTPDTARKNINNLDMVYLYPSGVFGLYTHEYLSKKYTMNVNSLGKSKYDLSLWINIPGERREWCQEIEGIAKIIYNLSSYFKKIEVLYDGMTSFDGQICKFEASDNKFYSIMFELLRIFDNKINIINLGLDHKYLCSDSEVFLTLNSLSGTDYRTKIAMCNHADICLVEVGTAYYVPFICNKPTVFYYSGSNFQENILMNFLIKNMSNVRYTDKKYIFVINPDDDFINQNYNISYEYIYNLLVELINIVKQKNISMLNLELKSLGDVNNKNNCYKIKYTKNIGARNRAENYLQYKIGKALLNARNPIKAVILPFTLFKIIKKHKKELELHKSLMALNPNLKAPKLEEYSDYNEAVKVMNNLPYKLGGLFIKHPFSFIFKAKKFCRDYKKYKTTF